MKVRSLSMSISMSITMAMLIGPVAGSFPASAAVSEQEAMRLEGELTPMGAERAGNAAGTIPAWDGGLTVPPPGISYNPGDHLPDPFAADQPLFTVSPANMAEYDAQLTDGQKAMLAAYPGTYFMKVYPSRRSCAYPPHVYQAVRQNALNGQLTENGNGVTGATMAAPFPIPQSAREVLWNHELGYRGFQVQRESVAAAPTKGGDFTADVALDQFIYSWSDPAVSKTEDLKNISYYFLKQGISPPSNSGSMTVFNNTLNQVAEERKVWNYRPGERKVKRTMGIAYDNVAPTSEGMRTSDTFQMFNGAADRYDWELLGKQEKIIAYNTNHFSSREYEYKDLLHKQHLNPEPMRYELHRVWVVEGKLKPGQKHVFAVRRLLYIDEDSWAVAAADLFDATGKLSRVQEGHIFNYYDQPLCAIGSEVIIDPSGGRYHVIGLRNQQKPVRFDVKLERELFSPAGMRRLGIR